MDGNTIKTAAATALVLLAMVLILRDPSPVPGSAPGSRPSLDEFLDRTSATGRETPSATATGSPAGLRDVDAVERRQAIEARNERDEATVRAMIDAATAEGFPVSSITVNAHAETTTEDPDVRAELTLDVTDTALVAPGQYRTSLVNDAIDEFEAALADAGLVPAPGDYFALHCTVPPGKAVVVVTAVIEHAGTTTEVDTAAPTLCFNP